MTQSCDEGLCWRRVSMCHVLTFSAWITFSCLVSEHFMCCNNCHQASFTWSVILLQSYWTTCIMFLVQKQITVQGTRKLTFSTVRQKGEYPWNTVWFSLFVHWINSCSRTKKTFCCIQINWCKCPIVCSCVVLIEHTVLFSVNYFHAFFSGWVYRNGGHPAQILGHSSE